MARQHTPGCPLRGGPICQALTAYHQVGSKRRQCADFLVLRALQVMPRYSWLPLLRLSRGQEQQNPWEYLRQQYR